MQGTVARKPSTGAALFQFETLETSSCPGLPGNAGSQRLGCSRAPRTARTTEEQPTVDLVRAAILLACSLAVTAPVHAQSSRYDSLANVRFEKDFSGKEASRTLRDELIFQRATQSYLPATGYFVILRLYGPKKEFFDQSWKPGDIEKTS